MNSENPEGQEKRYEGPDRRHSASSPEERFINDATDLALYSVANKTDVDDLVFRRAHDDPDSLRLAIKALFLERAGYSIEIEEAGKELKLSLEKIFTGLQGQPPEVNISEKEVSAEPVPVFNTFEFRGVQTGPVIIRKYLSPERTEEWLGEFKDRFESTQYLHEGVDFADVEEALRADQDAMRAFSELDKAGHETNVFGEDAETFTIGTCSLDAATGHRNVAYDKPAQDLSEKLYPHRKCDSNAVDIAADIGVDLMDEVQIKALIEKLNAKGLRLNDKSWDLFKTDAFTRGNKRVLCVRRGVVYGDVAYSSDVYGSFRAARKINKVKKVEEAA